MITFKISFIVGFSLKVAEGKNKGKKKGKKDKSKKDKGRKKNKQSSKNSKKAAKPVPEKPKYLFEPEKIIGVAHIEYELVPSKCKYQIDVKCWGPIAKVFSNDGEKLLKTVMRNDIAWVPVCIEHYLENLKIEEIKKFHDYIVKFNFNSNARKLGCMAKSDKSKKFYSYAHDAETDKFVDVFSEDPNLVQKTFGQQKKESLEKSMREIIMKCANFPKNDVVSYLYYSENYEMVYDIIENLCLGVEIEAKDFALPCETPTELCTIKKVRIQTDKEGGKGKKAKNDKSKKGAKGKKNKQAKVNPEIVTIPVPAEVFFTDPTLALYKAENNPGVMKNIYIYITVKQLLTTRQKLALNPLVIKIKKISNVPVNALTDIGISSIYATYSVPYIANCRTIEKPVKSRIKFNEAHMFFNDIVPKIKLLEFLQNQKLLVEIYGIKIPAPNKMVTTLFGNEREDEIISKIAPTVDTLKHKDIDNSSILLAVCTYDISSLVKNIWDCKEKGQCHTSGLTLFQKSVGCYDVIKYTDKKTINELNLTATHIKCKHPLAEHLLLKSGTTLQVEAYLMAPQTASLILHKFPNTFERIFMILYTEEFAKICLTNIFKHNEDLFSEICKNRGEINLDLINTDIITGFLVDNGNNFAIFIEGPSNGFIMDITTQLVADTNVKTGKIFLNSDTAFEQRLYTDFLNYGLYLTILVMPLHDILAKKRIYIEGNIAPACLEALKKLCLIFYSPSFKSILQNNLLPKPEELRSLNIEWGVPLRVQTNID